MIAVLAVVPACEAAQRREVNMDLGGKGLNVNSDISSLAGVLNLDSGSSFRPGEEAQRRALRTAKGSMRRRIRQTYGGLEVVGASADVEVTRDGQLRGAVSGVLAFHLQGDIPDPDACSRPTSVLLAVRLMMIVFMLITMTLILMIMTMKLMNLMRGKKYLRDVLGLSVNDNTPVENVKAFRKVDFEGNDKPAKIIYELDFFVDLLPTPSRPFFQLDACDPDLGVITYFDKIHNMTLALRERRQEEQCDTTPQPATTTTTTPDPNGACSTPAKGVGGNPKTGRIVYGENMPYCLNTQVDGTKCTMTSKHAIVIDLENTRDRTGREPVEFICADGKEDPINEAYGVANDALYYGYSTGLMYEQWYNLFALGYAPELRIHYGSCYENAFWNGVAMTFGDGCTYFYPLVNQDVIAHELGHGVTDKNSDLEYRAQSGGINEAFSDMAGEAAEYFSTGSNDWQVGREIFKGNRALRYFENPSQDGRSINSANDYTDGLDVHYSSGVFNRAFYHLVTSQGLPIKQAFEVMLQANRVIWDKRTNFVQGACGAMQAAFDLGYDVNKVKNAFAVVDIDLSTCNYQAFQQTMASGETRQGVIVSSLRNPVFTLEAPVGSSVVIDAGSSSDLPVTVSVTSDVAGSNVVTSGPAPFSFVMTSDTGYFKLSTSQDSDTFIDVTVDSA
ncbi:neutral protease-like [Babylonia areolata]|uniref:neutral protease-like n=1 Tax=Babylonia areolata TaxID=304850 RepID=UPI003FD116A5